MYISRSKNECQLMRLAGSKTTALLFSIKYSFRGLNRTYERCE